MKKLIGATIGLLGCLLGANLSFAFPALQLNIAGGTYYGAGVYDSTTLSNGPVFDLYAYLQPNEKNTIDDTYYLSMAVVPKTGPLGADLGSFLFNGTEINVTADMVYGVPPVELLGTAYQDPNDLSQHGIYETFFYEYGFSFNSPAATVGAYNVATGETAPGVMNYRSFSLDTTNLTEGYEIHFDLYNSRVCSGDVDVTSFAPFSKDAQSSRVPEPNTMLLLGTGLLGIGLLRKRKLF